MSAVPMRSESGRRYVLANWKMHKGQTEAEAWARTVAQHLKPRPDVTVVVLPPFTALAAAARALGGGVELGAQDTYPGTSGAVTGGVGTDQLRDLGVRYVLVGHSERRRLVGEDDSWVSRKVQAVLAAGMVPVVCVGEDAEERGEGRADGVVRRQVAQAVESVPAASLARIVWAYEPVWAIGSGNPATPDQAAEAASTLRSALRSRFGAEADNHPAPVLYGGSVDPDNVAQYAGAPGLDGALVGGASLDPDAFVRLVERVAP